MNQKIQKRRLLKGYYRNWITNGLSKYKSNK